MLQRGKAGLPFILVTVFLDMLGFGIVIPVLPALVGSIIADKPSQAYWYGALLASYGLAQFLSAPLLGAVSDRFGRRSVLLISIFGLGVNFLITALSPWLVLLLVSRLIGGASGASYTVAGAYIADITTPENRSRSFGLLGAVFGLGFICGPMIGGLLAANNLRLPYFAGVLAEGSPDCHRFQEGQPVLRRRSANQNPRHRQFSSGLCLHGVCAIPTPDDLGPLHFVPFRLGPTRERHFAFCGGDCRCSRPSRATRHPFEETRRYPHRLTRAGFYFYRLPSLWSRVSRLDDVRDHSGKRTRVCYQPRLARHRF